MNPYPRTWLEIDLPAIGHNLSVIRQRIGAHPKIALVAKADAYGHGLIPVGRHAISHGADWLAVATVQEGIALRDAGVEAPIIVLSPILPIEAEQAVFYSLRLMIESMEVAEAVSRASVRQSQTATLHLKVDTGLGRFGCSPGRAAELAAKIRALPGTELEGVATHFIASGTNRQATEKQIASFLSAAEPINLPMRHAANSAGAAAYPEARLDLVRVGINAYGIDPYAHYNSELAAAMCWRTRVMAIRTMVSGSTVSYAATRALDRKSRIATLGVGYGDGYPRSLSNRGHAMINGRLAPILGLVCMDQLMVDVTDCGEVNVGDDAVLIGDGASVEHLAELAATNCHEIVTRIMTRVPRRYRYA